jgi:hypothetical protein
MALSVTAEEVGPVTVWAFMQVNGGLGLGRQMSLQWQIKPSFYHKSVKKCKASKDSTRVAFDPQQCSRAVSRSRHLQYRHQPAHRQGRSKKPRYGPPECRSGGLMPALFTALSVKTSPCGHN